jgi:hypothetical protein
MAAARKKAKPKIQKKTKKRAKEKGAVPASMIRKIERIEKRLEKAGKEDRDIREEHRKLLKAVDEVADEEKVTQNVMLKVGKDLHKNIELLDRKQRFLGGQQEAIRKAGDKILKAEQESIKEIDALGKYSVKRKYYLELSRGFAGAFFGTAIVYSIISVPAMAMAMTSIQSATLLAFILVFSLFMLYRNQKLWVEQSAMVLAVKRLALLYLASIVMGVVALFLTGGLTMAIDAIFKSLVLGSFPAMAGAVLFLLVS